MGRFPTARAYFLEGFPREARQVEDFEQNVRTVNMAMILDYDEDTLRKHMQNRGLTVVSCIHCLSRGMAELFRT